MREKHVNTTMRKLFSNNHCKMHKHFKSFPKVEDAVLKPYTNVSKTDWEWLCKHFCSDEFQLHFLLTHFKEMVIQAFVPN